MGSLPSSILFCRQDGLGDVVLSLPLAAAAKRLSPPLRVGFLVRPGNGDIVRACREVDHVWEAGPRAALDARKLREWDVAVALFPSLKLARSLFLARVPRRVGTSRRAYSALFNERVPLHRRGSGRHETDLSFDLLDAVARSDRAARPTFTLPTDSLTRIANLLARKEISPSRRLAVLHPGSAGSSREWPAEHFRSVASRLARPDTTVVVTGSASERGLAARVLEGQPAAALSLAGETSLAELTALLACATVVVANSTGPLHLANALGSGAIGVFPPLADCGPARWGVLDHPERSLLPELPGGVCPFCTRNACPRGACMRLLAPEQVLRVAEPLLVAAPPWRARWKSWSVGRGHEIQIGSR